jgi:hypothetical protein
MLDPPRNGYYYDPTPAEVRLPSPVTSALNSPSRTRTLDSEPFASDQDWQARIDRLFDKQGSVQSSSAVPTVITQVSSPTSSASAITPPSEGTQSINELNITIKKLRGDKERLQEALWKKASKETVLQKEIEALKAKVRSFEETANTPVRDGATIDLEHEFDRLALVELENYLTQSTQELRTDVNNRGT